MTVETTRHERYVGSRDIDHDASGRRRRGGTGPGPDVLPRHWIWWTLGAVAVGAAAVGVYAWRQYRTLTSAKYNVINYTVPDRAASRRRARARPSTASTRRSRS